MVVARAEPRVTTTERFEALHIWHLSIWWKGVDLRQTWLQRFSRRIGVIAQRGETAIFKKLNEFGRSDLCFCQRP